MPELYRVRSLKPEIMDRPDQPPELARKFHRDLKVVHRLMGNWSTLVARLRNGHRPESVIDIGCGDGALLVYLRRTLSLRSVTGVDLKPPERAVGGVRVIAADATRDPLPAADAAVSVMVLHHLTDDQVIALVRNVGRSVKRFVCVDPVRHWLPMFLFTVLLCPLLSRVGAVDGRQSIRRAFKPEELRKLASTALEGRGTVDVTVTPLWSKLVLDIRFEK
jgi:2-polyprenyl-3-methyl-5-hydroxy-6-metoxy-1,4-benzoquinol methylase